MTLILKSVWGHIQRPWGYEVRVDFEDAGAVHNECLTFPKEPDANGIDDAVASLKTKVEARIAFESAEALKPLPPSVDELLAKVAKLEAEKTILIAEKVVLEEAVADAKAVK